MSAQLAVSVTDELVAELEGLANGVKGWNMPHSFQEPEEGFLPDDWEWHVGQIDEDDNRYPVLHVNAHQYDSGDSEKLARYYAACNRDTILALLAERAELLRDARRYRWLVEQGENTQWRNILRIVVDDYATLGDAINEVMRQEGKQ